MNIPRWVIWSILTVLAWGVWGALSKAVGGMSAIQSQVLSTLGILPIMAVLAVLPQCRAGVGNKRGALYAFGAGCLIGLGNLAYYQALAVGAKAATAVSLTALYPLMTVLLAVLILREKPAPAQGLGIIVSLVAIYLLSSASVGEEYSALVYALAPIVLWGVGALGMKMATQEVAAEPATFWFLASFVPLALVLLFIEPVQWDVPMRDWVLAALLGLTYGLGNLTVLFAYGQGGKASVVTPLVGLYPVVTIPLVIVFFGEQVGIREWIGIVLALGSGIALVMERSQSSVTEKPLPLAGPKSQPELMKTVAK